MPNGDIISGSSDGIVRVFSESEERWATASELKALEDQISSQSLPSQQVGDVKKSDLPGPEALSIAGIIPNIHMRLSLTSCREKGRGSENGSKWRCCRSTPGRSFRTDLHGTFSGFFSGIV